MLTDEQGEDGEYIEDSEIISNKTEFFILEPSASVSVSTDDLAEFEVKGDGPTKIEAANFFLNLKRSPF